MKIGMPFAANIHFGPDCWEWMSAKNRKGYGQYRLQGKLHIASRYAYELANGPIPEGLQVCHKCDNPKCVRHDHLFLGTNQENQIDSVNKKRHSQSKKTHCKNGHEFSKENTGIYKTERFCRTCNRNAVNRSYAKRVGKDASNSTL